MVDEDSPSQLFGEVPGFPAGSWFATRREAFDSGVHRRTQAGIAGRGWEGAESIVVSGGYEDDLDLGDRILYTGEGGRDAATGKQTGHQALIRGNLALARSSEDGLPVRVIRGSRGDSKWSPDTGYEYAGLFRVESYWRETGRSGFDIWRFLLTTLNHDLVEVPVDSTPVTHPTSLRMAAEERAEYSVGGPEDDPPSRRPSVVQRLVRSSARAHKVKILHDYRCQICGNFVETAAGPYAETGHIRPLGFPHNGSDSMGNMLCLCPNHHVAFDMGGIYVDQELQVVEVPTGQIIGHLRVHPGHEINRDNLEYHRRLFVGAGPIPRMDRENRY